MDVRFPADDPAWTMGRPYEVGRRFLYRWNDGDRLLLRGRAMVLLLAAALATIVFLWTRTLWGFPAAALGLLLTVTSPDVLAHGQLVTTDMGAALFIFAGVAAFERMTARLTARARRSSRAWPWGRRWPRSSRPSSCSRCSRCWRSWWRCARNR